MKGNDREDEDQRQDQHNYRINLETGRLVGVEPYNNRTLAKCSSSTKLSRWHNSFNALHASQKSSHMI